MKQTLILFFFLVVVLNSFSQVERDTIPTQNDSIRIIDENYREDQFYLSLTYNLLGNNIDGLSQRGFSAGFHFGFIRDMPINARRNWSIGAGLGISSNSYNQNLLIAEQSNGDFKYSIINQDSISFTKNKFTTYLLEVPLELRWRTSTAKDYKFWRIYTGVKFGYVFYNSSKFDGSIGNFTNSNISDMTTFRYGLTLSAGYSTWNAHLYYGLNSMFDSSAKIDGNSIDLTSIKIGLMFYIL